MGIQLVLSGIGKGSMFKHGRAFGIHNPFGSDIGKAKDPFINLNTLAKLSFHADQAVRNAVALNLGNRSLQDISFRNFNSEVIKNPLFIKNTSAKLCASAISFLTPANNQVQTGTTYETREVEKLDGNHMHLGWEEEEFTVPVFSYIHSQESITHAVALLNLRKSITEQIEVLQHLREIDRRSSGRIELNLASDKSTHVDILSHIASNSNVDILKSLLRNLNITVAIAVQVLNNWPQTFSWHEKVIEGEKEFSHYETPSGHVSNDGVTGAIPVYKPKTRIHTSNYSKKEDMQELASLLATHQAKHLTQIMTALKEANEELHTALLEHMPK